MFRSIVLAAVLMFAAVPAFAQEAAPNPCADLANATKGLSSDKVATILESCRTNASTPQIVEKMANPETASKWSEAAKGFAQALGIAAKELGIAANDFLDSPAGYLLAALLLFNYAGGFIVGLPVTLITMFMVYGLLRRIWTDKVEYETVNYFWGLIPVRRVKTRTRADFSEGTWVMTATVLAAAGILNLIVWMNVT
jgi:hypothetical protein